jgi:type II secretory pathway pseudopilin PulG
MNKLSRKGFVLPTVIFAITIMSIVAVAAVSTASDEQRTSRASRESTLAMYAAEAGLRQTYGAWPAATQLLKPGDSLDLGWKNLPNKAAYRAVIYRVDKGGLQEYAVIVQGRRTDPTAGIMTIVGAVGAVPTFKYAVSTDSALYLVTGGLFDGYDSEKGAYISTSADSTANLRAGVDIYISQTLVKGDVAAVGVVTLASGGVVTGTNTPSAPVVPPRDIIPCPITGYTPTANVPTGPGISYNAVSGVLSISGNNNSLTLTDTANGVNQFPRAVRVYLLPQVIYHHVDDVRPRVEVIAPRVLRDQSAAHHPSSVTHQVLEHRVFLWRQLDRVAVALNLSGVEIQAQIRDLERRRYPRARPP